MGGVKVMATTGGTNLRDDIMRLDETGKLYSLISPCAELPYFLSCFTLTIVCSNKPVLLMTKFNIFL